MRHSLRRLSGISAVVISAVVLTGCGTDDDGGDNGSGQTTSAAPEADLDAIEADPALAAQVPPKYAERTRAFLSRVL